MNINYYTYQGKQVTTKDLAVICGKSVKWVRKAVYRYKTIDELIEVGCTRRKKYTYKGTTGYVKDLIKFSKVPYSTLRQRLYKGWSLERALNEGVNK